MSEYEDPYNGHEYVDLGLPSGLKWATCNVGAESPENAGLYFAWGETTGYTIEQAAKGERLFDEDTYNAGSAASISTNLTLEQDAAHVNMGGKWRMPTVEEYQELIDNCTSRWTMEYEDMWIQGRIFTGSNGNSIYFRSGGFISSNNPINVDSVIEYWSSSWHSLSGAMHLYSHKDYVGVNYYNRYYGFNVRGVCE